MADIERALALMLKAHAGQIDKGGKPYVLHPLRVMHSVQSMDEKVVALLHDVVEDSDVSFQSLSDLGFSDEVIGAVRALTKIEGENYMDYISRIKQSKLAVAVKLADLSDNMNLARLDVLDEKTFDRMARYHLALKLLSPASK